MENHTIANIITPLGESGVGIIRISGPKAFSLVDKVFKPWNSLAYEQKESHRVYLGKIIASGEVLDEVLVLLMKGPHSFTGEDTVEIHCHGNPFILKEVLKELLHQGARKSARGEFTRQAFLNGRLDLTQSEAILDTIRANNRKALSLSLSQLEGSLKRKIQRVKGEVMGIVAYLEASIDFPDDEIEDSFTRDQLRLKAGEVLEHINSLLATYSQGKLVKEGLLTVLIGRPNAGKSSLLNSLLQEDRAIITHLPGTTRDAIQEQVNIGDLVLNLVDTAGFRATEDLIEHLGIQKTLDYIQQAQLILFLVDVQEGLTLEDQAMLDHLHSMDKPYLILYNKMDLAGELPPLSPDSLYISVKENQGLVSLKTRIKDIFLKDEVEDYSITNLRYFESLSGAKEAVSNFLQGLDSNAIPYDLLSIELKEAYLALARITGDDYSQDLLDQIFSQFCIGK